MTRSTEIRRWPEVAWVLGPVLYAFGATVFLADNSLLALGINRAQVQGGLGLPLLLLAPGILAVGWLPGGRQWIARRVAVLFAGVIAVGVTVLIASSATQVACQPVSPPLGALPQAVALGVIAGGSFALSTAAGARLAATGRPGMAILVGAGTAGLTYGVQLVAFLILFPVLSCAR